MTNPRKVRWLIAHQPVELFVRTAKAFREELNKRIPGQIDIDIVTVPEYLAERNGTSDLETILDDDLEKASSAVDALFAALNDDIQLSQTQMALIAYKDPAFSVLDLPFLFTDHDHVSRVAEGPIGKEIRDNLEKITNVKGLAFTYSGGYRVIGSNHKISNLEELNKQRCIVASPGPREDTLKAVGMETIIVNPVIWGGWDRVTDDADAVETTYLRFKDGNYILKTNHSMFMTTILAGKEFWESLTEEQKQAFEESAIVTAKVEREWAVEDAEIYERDSIANGIEITSMSEEDETLLKKKAYYTYLPYAQQFGDLIKRIKLS